MMPPLIIWQEQTMATSRLKKQPIHSPVTKHPGTKEFGLIPPSVDFV
jgi:hypothetical protein